MSILNGRLVPRILLGMMSILTLLLAWGSILSIFTFGPSVESVLVLAFTAPLTLICLLVAAGRAPFQIRE